jgi:transcription elongation factor SPT6
MLNSGQFLHILAAENEHLVTISIFIPQEVTRAGFERKLLDVFSSDSFSDTAKAWNTERSLVVEEVIDNT